MRSITSLLSLFTKKSKRDQLLSLYEQTKFAIPFYLNELALYKFILERQQNTLADEYRFQERHIKLCGICSKAIQDLDNLICDLELEQVENVQVYLKELNKNVHVRINRPSGLQYKLNSN